MLLNEYGDLIPTLPIFDSHVCNAISTHGLLNGYSAGGGFVLLWSSIQVEPYDMSSIIWGWYQINVGGWILCEVSN